MGEPSAVRRLLRLAIPVTLGRTGVMVMGVTDLVVLGQLASRELPMLGLGWTLCGPALIGGLGLMTGVQVLTARTAGEGRPEAAGPIWRRGLIIGVVAGLLVIAATGLGARSLYGLLGVADALAAPGAHVATILALSIPLHLAFVASTNHLEARQRPTPGAVVMWGANGLNLVLNLVLVPRYGAEGSAWSTVVSRLALAVVLGGYVLSPWALGLRAAAARVADAPGVAALLRIGVPAATAGAIEAAAFAAMSVISARVGAEALAAFQVAGNLVSLVFMVSVGLGTAGAVLAADAIGRGAAREAARFGWLAIGVDVAAMAVCAIAVTVFAHPVSRAYLSDPGMAAVVAGVMGLIGLLMIPDGGQGVADSVLRAHGDNWFPTVSRMAAYMLVAPPLALWLAEGRGLGSAGVLIALNAASFLALAGLVVRYAVVSRGQALAAAPPPGEG